MDNQRTARGLAGAVLIWLLLWLLVFFDSLRSAASVWLVNDTFNHCFLVLPAVLYALWQERGGILQRSPGYSAIGLLGVLGVMVVYALGQAAYIELLQHLAVFGLLPAMALFLFGWRVALTVWAPLLFVMFSVPVGEELMPQFQEITADMAVAMLKAIGVPVHRNGLYISVPNGDFVVAEACSGVRFFIACVVIGCAYAYLSFVNWWRSALFMVFAVILPIVANGIRAFGIIYIGHATEMEHAAGADHLIYGWFFFAIVVVVLILVGHWFSDGQRRWRNTVTEVDARWRSRRRPLLLAAALLPLLLALGVKALVGQQAGGQFHLEPAGLDPVSEQRAGELAWAPRLTGADRYRVGRDPVFAVQQYQAIYFTTEPGRELLSYAQRVFDLERWSLKSQYSQPVAGLGTVNVSHLTALSGRQRLLAHWYVVPGLVSSHGPVIKLQQAVNGLLLRSSGGALVAVSLSFRGDPEPARERLAEVLNARAAALSRPRSSAGECTELNDGTCQE